MTPFGHIDTHTAPAPAADSPFRSIVCGIDGSRADAEVARQAAMLAGRGAELELVAVAWEIGTGLTAQATLTHAHADAALDRASAIVRDAGARPVCRRVDAADAAAILVKIGAGHDLLVLGCSGMGRLGGIATGRPGTTALHRADCHVLIARPAPGGRPFPQRILLADDGTPATDAPARLAAALAGRHEASVDVAAPLSMAEPERLRLARHGAEIMAAGAPEPVMVDVVGPAQRALPRLARELESSLLVIGSRRLSGTRALTSVSERVAHSAPCSVLVTRRSAEA